MLMAAADDDQDKPGVQETANLLIGAVRIRMRPGRGPEPCRHHRSAGSPAALHRPGRPERAVPARAARRRDSGTAGLAGSAAGEGTASAAALGVAGGRGRGGSGNHRQLGLPQRHRRAAAERRVVVIQQCDGRDIHRGDGGGRRRDRAAGCVAELGRRQAAGGAVRRPHGGSRSAHRVRPRRGYLPGLAPAPSARQQLGRRPGLTPGKAARVDKGAVPHEFRHLRFLGLGRIAGGSVAAAAGLGYRSSPGSRL